MSADKLTLRSLTSRWVTPIPDITKNIPLNFTDGDNNFIYLKGEIVSGATVSGGTLLIEKINGDNISVNLNPSGYTGTYTAGTAVVTVVNGIITNVV